MLELWWWGYLHQDGTIHLKRWFGDHRDYTEDCEGNEFVQRVVPPFLAVDYETALKRLYNLLKL